MTKSFPQPISFFLAPRDHRGTTLVAMAALLGLIVLGLGGCAQQNSDFCCTRESACDYHAAPGPVACPEGLVCVDFATTCVPAVMACQSSADCTDPAMPMCSGGACGGCSSDMDCPVSSPVCASGGAGSLLCQWCSNDDDCARFGDAPFCDTVEGRCASCRSSADCSADAPMCDDGACRGCEAGGALCLEVASVQYVTTDGNDSGSCTRAQPCRTLQFAVNQASAARRGINLGAGTYETVTVRIENKAVIVSGAVASVVPPIPSEPPPEVPPAAIEVLGSADVILERLTVKRAAGDGIVCRGVDTATPRLTLVNAYVIDSGGRGIVATSCILEVKASQVKRSGRTAIDVLGGTATVSRSIVQDNRDGGISVAGAGFELSNNVIAGNGGFQAGFGGVRLAQIGGVTPRRFEFNTVAWNAGAEGGVNGVSCVEVSAPITLSSSIVWDNRAGGSVSEVGGAQCTWTYSIIGPQEQVQAGDQNLNVDPKIIGFSEDVLRANYHLMPDSPAIDAADPAATERTDIDGERRPAARGAGRADIGADEVR
jgi:hypothetical protein